MASMKTLGGLALALSLMGTAPVQAAGEIDVFYYDLADQFTSSLNNAFKARADQLNVKLKSYDATDNMSTQIIQLESVSPENPWIINLVDRSYAKKLVEDPKVSNLRMIFINRAPARPVLHGHNNAFYIGSNPVEAGNIQGQMIIDYLKAHPEVDRNGDGKISVVLLKGEASHQDTEQRMQNALATLREHGVAFEQVDVLRANWSYDQAFTAMEQSIMRNGIDKVELVISNNDAMALGAIASLNNKGFNTRDSAKTIPVFGVDAIPDAVKAVADGTMAGTVDYDVAKLAEVSLALATATGNDRDAISKEIGYTVDADGFITIPFKAVTRN